MTNPKYARRRQGPTKRGFDETYPTPWLGTVAGRFALTQLQKPGYDRSWV